MISKNRLQQILIEYRTRLEEILGDALDSVVLYGSQARGDDVEGSDIDVLCVMKGPFDYGELLDRTSEVSAELSLKHDVVLSRVFVTRQDFQHREIPFLMNVRREGSRCEPERSPGLDRKGKGKSRRRPAPAAKWTP